MHAVIKVRRHRHRHRAGAAAEHLRAVHPGAHRGPSVGRAAGHRPGAGPAADRDARRHGDGAQRRAGHGTELTVRLPVLARAPGRPSRARCRRRPLPSIPLAAHPGRRRQRRRRRVADAAAAARRARRAHRPRRRRGAGHRRRVQAADRAARPRHAEDGRLRDGARDPQAPMGQARHARRADRLGPAAGPRSGPPRPASTRTWSSRWPRVELFEALAFVRPQAGAASQAAQIG